MITPTKDKFLAERRGKFLANQITTTPEVIAALSPIERRICQALVKVGDIQLVEPEERA